MNNPAQDDKALLRSCGKTKFTKDFHHEQNYDIMQTIFLPKKIHGKQTNSPCQKHLSHPITEISPKESIRSSLSFIISPFQFSNDLNGQQQRGNQPHKTKP